MTKLFLVFALSMLGCSTEIKDPRTGITVAKIHSNAKNVSMTWPGCSFHADSIDNSTPTRAVGSVVGTAGSTFAVSGLGAILK